MFNSKKKKAEAAKRQQKQLIQIALVSAGSAMIGLAAGNAIEYLAGKKVRDAQNELRRELVEQSAANAAAISQLQKEVAANAESSHEALVALTGGIDDLAEAVKANATEVEEIKAAGEVAAERRASLAVEIEILKAKISGTKPNGVKPNGTNGVKPNGVKNSKANP